jgi:hypothetical protein
MRAAGWANISFVIPKVVMKILKGQVHRMESAAEGENGQKLVKSRDEVSIE